MQTVEHARAARFRFNPVDPAFQADPYPIYARMRREAPHLRTLGTLVLTRHADVLAALKTRELSVALIPETIERSARTLGVDDVDQIGRFIRNSIVFTDNPAHLRLRRLVNQAYGPKRLDALKATIDRQVSELFDEFDEIEAGLGSADFVATVARPLPVNVLCAWMRVPDEKREWIAEHIHVIRYLLDPGLIDRDRLDRTRASLRVLTAYFVAHLRTLGDDDLGIVTQLKAARYEGDGLDETEVAFACIMSFVAGTETTESLIGNLFHVLLEHGETLAALRADRTLADAAVDEAIRYETPLQMTKRVARGPLSFNGIDVRAGEQILLCLGAANRDAEVFDEPEAFRLDRDGPPNVGFGYGMHACLGGVLAKLQASCTLLHALERYDQWHRCSTQTHWQRHSVILRGLDALPLQFARRGAKR